VLAFHDSACSLSRFTAYNKYWANRVLEDSVNEDLDSDNQVWLGEDANCLLALWVDRLRELEGVRIDKVYICGERLQE
jgi:hypothetical protein